MTLVETKAAGSRVLAERLAEGTISVEETLRYAALLGEALRKLHDSGKSHGSVSPETILVTAGGLELMPPAETGGPADVPADIFGFGVVLSKMLGSPKLPSGEGPADRVGTEDHGLGPLIAACLAKDPAERPPSIRKALLELKLASLSARHSGMAAMRCDADAAVRAEIQRSEEQQEARLKQHEISMAEKEKAASEALNSMRAEVDAMQAKLTDAQRSADANASRVVELESGVQTAVQQLAGKLAEAVEKIERQIGAEGAVLESIRRSMAQTDDLIGRVVETVEAKLEAAHRSAKENADRLDTVEGGIKAAADQNAKLEIRLADGLRQIRMDVEARAAAVESVRRSTAQTDDLVGRLVEAVESMLDLGAVRA